MNGVSTAQRLARAGVDVILFTGSVLTIGASHRNITTDLLTGEMKSTATNVHIVVPGQGTVQLAAGLFEIDGDGNLVKEVGRQDPPVRPALCAALA